MQRNRDFVPVQSAHLIHVNWRARDAKGSVDWVSLRLYFSCSGFTSPAFKAPVSLNKFGVDCANETLVSTTCILNDKPSDVVCPMFCQVNSLQNHPSARSVRNEQAVIVKNWDGNATQWKYHPKKSLCGDTGYGALPRPQFVHQGKMRSTRHVKVMFRVDPLYQ